MWEGLEDEIVLVCSRKIRQHERRRSALSAELMRRRKRSIGDPGSMSDQLPDLWRANPNLDPYSVLRRAASLAHGIRRAAHKGLYHPRPPTYFDVRKSGGSTRRVASFEIADEAVSRLLFRSLHSKNRSLFGAHTYAYRQDVGVYDAVRYVSSEWSRHARLFVGEYDLKSYFDSLSHDYLFSSLADTKTLHALPEEIHYCKEFVRVHSGSAGHQGVSARSGIPQGTTVSLFLANLAMLPLDRDLERIGVGFTRYADDTLLWSPDYATICRGVEAVHKWSELSGVALNSGKSPGIRLLVADERLATEMRSVLDVEYLGHRIAIGSVRPKRSRMRDIRSQIVAIVYATLLKEPMSGTQRLSRVAGGLDRDYVSLIWQLRRLLYGRLSERQVRRLSRGVVPRTGLSGVVAQFPVVSDTDDFRSLDRWIRRRVWLALRRRATLLSPKITGAKPAVWDKSIGDLISATARSSSTGQPIDLTLPSAGLMAAVVQRAIQLHGPGVVRGSTRLYLEP